MDAGDRRSIQFAITNENPVPITVKQFRHSLEAVSSLRLLGVEPGNQTVLANPKRGPTRDATDEWAPVSPYLTIVSTLSIEARKQLMFRIFFASFVLRLIDNSRLKASRMAPRLHYYRSD